VEGFGGPRTEEGVGRFVRGGDGGWLGEGGRVERHAAVMMLFGVEGEGAGGVGMA
jgi:hypothetical protein